MVLFDGGFGIVLFGVWVFCIIDVITTPEAECRNLPKVLWLLIVILLVDLGAIAWLIAGRNWSGGAKNLRYQGTRSDRPARPGVRQRSRPTSPDDDEEFLAGLRARAEEQRRRAREQPPGDEPPAG
jgi:hypothetical protein